MESSVFLSDLLTAHEPKMRKSFKIKRGIFRFMGGKFCRSDPLKK